MNNQCPIGAVSSKKMNDAKSNTIGFSYGSTTMKSREGIVQNDSVGSYIRKV